MRRSWTRCLKFQLTTTSAWATDARATWSASTREAAGTIEAVCGLFDECRIDDLLDSDWPRSNLDANGQAALQSLIDALHDFNQQIGRNPTDEDVLSHPSWPNIRALAQQALGGLERAGIGR